MISRWALSNQTGFGFGGWLNPGGCHGGSLGAYFWRHCSIFSVMVGGGGSRRGGGGGEGVLGSASNEAGVGAAKTSAVNDDPPGTACGTPPATTGIAKDASGMREPCIAPCAAIASATTTSILWLCFSFVIRQPRPVSTAMAREMARRMSASG